MSIFQNKTALCFEGGGVLGVGHVGALSRFQELGGLQNVTHVIGTSVGSFITAALGCGADFQFIHDIFLGLDISKFEDKPKCACVNLYRLFKNFGPNKGTEIKRVAAQIIQDLTGNPNTTFKQAFDKYGIHTTIVYLSVNYQKTIYANHVTTPNLMIRDAILRSSAIPIFYEAITNDANTEMFVDGGVTDNYPIHVLRDIGCKLENILGFKLCSQIEMNQYLEDTDQAHEVVEKDHGKPKKLYDYIKRLVGIVHNQALRYHVDERDWDVTVKIDIGKLNTTDFDLSEEQKNWLYEQGRQAVDRFVQESE